MDIQVDSRELKQVLSLIANSIKKTKDDDFKHAFGKNSSVMYCDDVNLIQILGNSGDKFISFFTTRTEGIKLEKKGRYVNITDIEKVAPSFDENIVKLLNKDENIIYQTNADYGEINDMYSVENIISAIYLALSQFNFILRYETLELIKTQILNVPILQEITVFFLDKTFIKLVLKTVNYTIKIITARRLI